jgi:hypothetical protein
MSTKRPLPERLHDAYEWTDLAGELEWLVANRPAPAVEEEPVTYAIKWGHGQTDTGFASFEDAEKAVRSVLSEAEIGHSGDISDGGERTLFWASAEAAENDDGARASGSIVVRHPAERNPTS